jgi:DNA-binding response OmpR family regulator
VSELLLVTGVLEPSSEVLPALGLLLHSVRVLPADASALVEAPPADVVLVDARRDLAHAKSICRLLHTTGLDCPMLAIVTEGGLAAISAEWNADDVILNTAGPAEVEARLRLATGRRAIRAAADAPDEIRSGDLAIDEATYSARLRGRVLDLTFKEFELIKFLPAGYSPGRTSSRRSGVTTTSAARGPWTCTSGGCGPSSVPSTRRSSAPCGTSATGSSR